MISQRFRSLILNMEVFMLLALLYAFPEYALATTHGAREGSGEEDSLAGLPCEHFDDDDTDRVFLVRG
jgi:hypothetical protein